MASGVEVRHLTEVPGALDRLVAWYVEAWEPYYGPAGPGNARADLSAALTGATLPICLVATDASGAVVGTISLRESSFSHGELTPWATGLLTAAARGADLASTLVDAVEKEAQRLGYDRVHVADTSDSVFGRRGWAPIDATETLRGRVDVLVKLFAGGAGS